MARRDLAAAAALSALAVAFVAGDLWRRALQGEGVPSADIYAAQYQNLVYALNQLHDGHGLLWNRLQNCGQPFLPSTLLGLFYPVHLLFFFGLEANTAFIAAAALHLALGGIGTYLWCRSLECGALASFCGGVAFTLGAAAISMAVWVPTTILGPYAGAPWAMFCCERLLRRPTARSCIALGVVLSIQVLAAYPQIDVFTYQLLVLRAAWESATGQRRRLASTWALLLVALALPLLLAGIQLYPMAEFARLSVRNRQLSPEEANPFGVLTWAAFRAELATRQFGRGIATVLSFVPVALAGLSVTPRRHRRMGLFYVCVGLLYLGLSFDTPLQAAWLRLPIAKAFRLPERFLWMVGLVLSPAIALACDALRAPVPHRVALWGRVAAILAGGGLFWALAPDGLWAREWVFLAILAVACAAGSVSGRAAVPATLAVAVLLSVSLWQLNARPFLGFMTDGRALYADGAAFDVVRSRATLQDRMYVLGRNFDWGLSAKVASLVGLPSIDDYEPQSSQRYAELLVRLLYDVPMQSLNMHAFRIQPIPLNRHLFDLTAARFVVADEEFALKLRRRLQPQLQRLWREGRVTVYENEQALPRAFFVPRLDVVAEPAALLERLASPAHDPRQVALVEAPPADGFLGGEGAATGTVDIAADESEGLVLQVRAGGAGFVSLQDQLYPGWVATVNGAPAEIVRANYAFRVVRVPAGESRVEFTYRPRSVAAGAAATLAGLAGVAVVLFRSRRRASGAP